MRQKSFILMLLVTLFFFVVPDFSSAQSCQGICGQQHSTGCWCDDQCASFGDCCPDYEEVCGAPTKTCVGHCGGEGVGGCYCDAACVGLGDCCPDYEEVCGGTAQDDFSDHCGGAYDITSNWGVWYNGVLWYKIEGSINFSGDRDWFSVKFPDSGEMDILTTGSTNTRGLLMSNWGNINCFGWEVEDDDSGSDQNFSITHGVNPNQEYWIRVSHSNLTYGGTGEYVLWVAYAKGGSIL